MRKKIKKLKTVFISMFIVANFMMMIRAQLKLNSPIIDFIYNPVTYIQNGFSLWQDWMMFAPDPNMMNGFIDAKIVYLDGSEMIWTFPRPQEGNLFDRYMHGERYRKYLMDGLRLDKNKFLWEDGARFVIRKTAKLHEGKKPEKIILIRRYKYIPNWNIKFIKHKKKIPRSKYNSFEFYTYKPSDI